MSSQDENRVEELNRIRRHTAITNEDLIEYYQSRGIISPLDMEVAVPDLIGEKLGKTNPKDLLGMQKAPLNLLVGLEAEAWAMKNGCDKYGERNWRKNAVRADIYIAACMRHLTAWYSGENVAEDSGVHHLGHAKACLAILLDAEASGCLIDNRPGVNDDNV